ncbi:hypothetical protein E6Q11_06795 [Candidatus Dojkabacteria bacterium]|uniref:Uncharacterized protein n=1 Tax=Candidatus Dojkabacteria bacterium TaxID=2099670 RepID=A0A5C7J2M8_9BACT|nr:MAG: hypothetical protein E6Q11_06795 [Candidatus Dojkabacteria bacterium]
MTDSRLPRPKNFVSVSGRKAAAKAKAGTRPPRAALPATARALAKTWRALTPAEQQAHMAELKQSDKELYTLVADLLKRYAAAAAGAGALGIGTSAAPDHKKAEADCFRSRANFSRDR